MVNEKNFECDFSDIVGVAYEDTDFSKLSREEIIKIVKSEVISKINTIGVEAWVDSFINKESIKEVK